MLILLAGLPGTGKTTLARLLARQRRAAHVRLDAIEAAMRRRGHSDASIGPTGYVIAEAVAATCLAAGTPVVVDAVCPVPKSRQAWRTVARAAACPMAAVELGVSDLAEHRRRVEGRTSDLEGLTVPTWRQVSERDYHPWDERRDGPRLRLDNHAAPGAALALVNAYLDDHINIDDRPGLP